MLATIPQDIPLREHSHLDLQPNNRDSHGDTIQLEDRLCPGCKRSAVNEQGGLVVAFGQSFFHVDCFKCAKCRNQVTADTNLLLLSDGSPICANCSYSCNICRLPILDEAIMTGDDSYHAHCFKCKVCSNRIDELVFAKTSQGIYCMNCHSERMIKIRKHAQKKAEREKAQGASGSSRTRENDARNFQRDNERLPLEGQSRSGSTRSHGTPTSSRNDISRAQESIRSPEKPIQGAYVSDAFEAKYPAYPHTNGARSHTTPLPSPSTSSFPSKSPSVTAASIAEQENRGIAVKSNPHLPSDLFGQHNNPSKSNTLPLQPVSPDPEFKRRSSFDDGVRPLNVLFNQDNFVQDGGSIHLDTTHTSLTPDALSVTPRQDKRRSINPGLSLSPYTDPSLTLSTKLPPRRPSFETQQPNRPPTPSYLTLETSQPLTVKSVSRPPSRNESLHSSRSSSGTQEIQWSRSRSSSVRTNSYDRFADDTVVMTSPPSMAAELEPSNALPPSVSSQGSYPRPLPNPGGPQGQRSSATLSPTDINGFRTPHRYSTSSTRSIEGHRSASVSRSASPAYRADVPHGVESGTDTEPENDTDEPKRQDLLPPVPPPKDSNVFRSAYSTTYDYNGDFDNSDLSQLGDISDDFVESLPVERMSHTTFIAPALPPIRFSMNTADFSELLGSVNGLPSLKSLDNLAKLTKSPLVDIPSTPPPTVLPTNITDPKHSSPESSAKSHPVVAISQSPPLLKLNDISRSPGTSSDLEDDESQTTISQTRTPHNAAHITITEPGSNLAITLRQTLADHVVVKLREALANVKERGAQQLKLDIDFVDAIINLVESRSAEYDQLKTRVDGMNRESKQYMDGMTVAQTEYDRELKARRDAEAEVTRLRVLLSGQAVRLTALSGDSRRQEVRQQLSRELHDNLSGLEHDLSRLKVERDMTLAEVEELSATKSSQGTLDEVAPSNLGRSFTKRLDHIRNQYQRDLIPLTEQKEVLTREIAELKAVRDVFLEETTVLNARNEELAQLSAVYARRIENPPETPAKVPQDSTRNSYENSRLQMQPSTLIAPSLSSSTSGSSTIHDENQDSRFIKAPKLDNELHTPAKAKFKWPGTKAKESVSPASNVETSKGKAHIEHNFQQLSVLRFTRCDHCGDKMWGSQLRCTACSTSIHVRCIANVQIPCTQHQHVLRDDNQHVPLPPSMFGRDLTEQVRADSTDEERQIPVIVEKCIEAVEARALDYEGIYRKTGGSGQSKAITQMFERGDYDSFDLCDSDRFNDICSVTSVLKTYFRSLPVPLLTFDLHDQFMAAIAIRDPSLKQKSLVDMVNRLPDEHYFTLRALMLHLHHVRERCERNLMNGRNLGVVFGPTLLRSRDPGAEFSDMAGKALFVEWLVDNAPHVFNTT
ncbi:hypothetical protein B0H34DRAFT_699173 [Crassisporium funariophilum]|nr:hypothetical protein B0H34DRAFT_699173 [Crassisporium funariophilum]